jgi:squalene-associated FAD-dependent desaturase
MTGTVHVIGAGLAGLSAATILAERGMTVTVSEAAAQAGGRCRSYFDPQLGRVIDNGNHLVLSGNRAVNAYLTRLGATDRLAGPKTADFAFVDLRDGTRWRVQPNDGPIPWWIFAKSRRPPGTKPADFLPLATLMQRRSDRRIDQAIRCHGWAWHSLLEPILLAVLNTDPKEASAALAGAVVRESLAKGGRASAPRIAEPTLAAAFVEPALAYLAARGAPAKFNRRLKALHQVQGRIAALDFSDGTVELGADDRVILAVPPAVAQGLVAGLPAPFEYRAIVNAHFALPEGTQDRLRRAAPMTGVIGGTAEWVFVFDDRLSVTISGAADRLVEMDREALARLLWTDVARTLDLGDTPLPTWQIVKEKRATFAATPEQNAMRPGAATRLANLWLAGDWTQTGLPATIEGALRSGETAAALAL